uniref:Putative TyrA protein n=1 Tax=Schistosoma japonicum TaxID=6182 RepID=C1LEZ9_SCHJA|nr:putative TyrA protein [Schistosoma japonicum]
MRFVLLLTRGFRSVTRKTPFNGCFVAGGSLLASYALYSNRNIFNEKPFLSALCATKFAPQGSVVSETKSHALYLTIHLDPRASPQECLKSVGQIKKYVDTICPPDLRGEEDEILYGVGFGLEFYRKVNPGFESRGVSSYEYRERSGSLGKLPNTGGDIFIHAKCHEYGKLFELTQSIINNLPAGSVAKFEDVYGWVYRNGRDLSGFIDGTENPADPDERAEVAINTKTGGSYAVVQKWIHNMDLIQSTKDQTKEGWIGRTLDDSVELKKKPITSHVARMVGSADYDAPSKFKIVRQSQPYGTLSGDAGLLFIAYAADTKNFDFMLDRMTGDSEDRKNDDVMRFTRCVTGNYWYFPSVPEFDRLVGSGLWGFW